MSDTLAKIFGKSPQLHAVPTALAPEPIPAALRDLYAVQKRLADAFPNYRFTIDGNIIGDIGEAIAEAVFGLEKLSCNTKGHDFRAPNNWLVQVKATQRAASGRGVGLGLDKRSFEHVIVIEFDREGFYEVLYNGPGRYIDAARAHKSSASLSRVQLRRCQEKVPPAERLPKV